MRVLITGACGFVGQQLARELLVHGHELVLATHERTSMKVAGETLPATPCDVRDHAGIQALVGTAKADAVAHLAGLAQVIDAAKDRTRLSSINTVGVHNLCAAIAAVATRPTAGLFASSAFVYGNAYQGRVEINEDSPVQPHTPYGHSKLAAEHVGQCFEGEAISFYVARPFNHIGPGQTTSFVCPGFAQRILNTPAGGSIDVGNLASRRDFCDVRDIVRAYRLILEKKPPSRLFVLGSGQSVAIQEILDHLLQISGKQVGSHVNPGLYRPSDPCDMIADSRLAHKQLGWSCEIPLRRSLADVYAALAAHDKISESLPQ